MTSAAPSAHPTPAQTIPPAKYWHLSPTYSHWVKLSAWNIVHTLRREPGYEGQDVLFYAAHPIRYAYLVAPLASLDTPSPTTTVLLLDDSSGACIEAVIRADTVPGLVRYADGAVTLDTTTLAPGTVLKVKGTFTSFRGVRQLEVKRLSVLGGGTTAEVAAWRARAEYKTTVLERPWRLSDAEREKVDAENAKEAAAECLRVAREKLRRVQKGKKKEEHERRKEERNAKREDKRREEERQMNAGALV
ncbi:hypothetical protein ANO11243_001690 [Dothideomycetidae sp. 11243]|nr:hypothetical protein ANO11243_001690 [fungal sp. No.11243]